MAKINVKTYVALNPDPDFYTIKSQGVYRVNFFDPVKKNQEATGLILKNQPFHLAMKTADCVPLVIGHNGQSIIILLHLDWLGTCLNIVKRAVVKAKTRYDFNLADCEANIGPSICQNYYCNKGLKGCLKSFLFTIFGLKKYKKKINKFWNFDLAGAVRQQLADLGIKTINQDQRCTYCDGLPSKRREGKNKSQNLITEAWLSYEN